MDHRHRTCRHYLGLAAMVCALVAAGPAAAQDAPDTADHPSADDHAATAPSDMGADDEAADDQIADDQMPDDDAPDDDAPADDAPADDAPAPIAETYEEPAAVVDDDRPSTLLPMGMSLTVGGGLNGFLDGDFNDVVDTGAGWEGRLTVGTRSIVGLEAAYVGTSNDIDALGVDDDANLVSNGLEAAIRLDLSRTVIRPYVLAGAGWKHYSVQNTDANTSSIADSDNVVEFPLGAGLSYQFDRFIADLRATFRPAIDNDLFRSQIDLDENELHTWKAAANVGFEF